MDEDFSNKIVERVEAISRSGAFPLSLSRHSARRQIPAPQVLERLTCTTHGITYRTTTIMGIDKTNYSVATHCPSLTQRSDHPNDTSNAHLNAIVGDVNRMVISSGFFIIEIFT